MNGLRVKAGNFVIAALACALMLAATACAPTYGERRAVGRGETIESIARKAGVSPKAVREMNYLSPEDQVSEGDIIFLPAPDGDYAAGREAVPAEKGPPPKAKAAKEREKAKPAPSGVVGQSAVPAIKSRVLPPVAAPQKSAKAAKLAWPVGGGVLRAFGREGGKGIEIATKSGEIVKASASGQVNYAGLPARAYGTMAIIDHGGDFYTVYSNMAALKVRTGDKIAAGEPVGSAGEFLHFEVRKGTVAEDPLLHLPAR